MITKNWFSADSPHRYFLCIIFLVAALNVFVRLNFLPPTISGDAHGYIDTARLISGEKGEGLTLYPGRLLKPLTPLGILLFTPLFHGNMIAGFLALNTLCYVLLALAMYALLLLFTTDRFLAMLGTLIFISAYPVLEYGLNLFSDIGSWLLFVVAIFGAVRYYRDASWKNLSIALAAVVTGLLWKEYAVLAGIFFGLVICCEPTRSWKEKFARIFLLGACSAVVIGIMQWIVYIQFHYTYIDFILEAASVSPVLTEHTPYFIAKSIFAVLLLGWGLVLAGLWHWRSIPRRDQYTLLMLLPPSLLCLFWTFVSSRLYYVMAPLLAILALHGLKTLSSRRLVQVLATVVIILGSYTWLFASGTLRAFLQ